MIFKVLLKYIFGYVRIVIEGYYIERFINICTNSKILMWNLKREKGVKLYLNVGIQDYYETVKIAKKLKCKVKIIKKKGMPFVLNRYRRRKAFVLSLIIILLLLYISSNYIWNIQIQIEDNAKIDNIVEDINSAGLQIGMKKNKINSVSYNVENISIGNHVVTAKCSSNFKNYTIEEHITQGEFTVEP